MCQTCEDAKSILHEWMDKQGHDRCWYYPELFRQLADLYDVEPTNEKELPPRNEFELGCHRYQDEEYGNTPINNSNELS